jgi:hypothetical protein
MQQQEGVHHHLQQDMESIEDYIMLKTGYLIRSIQLP